MNYLVGVAVLVALVSREVVVVAFSRLGRDLNDGGNGAGDGIEVGREQIHVTGRGPQRLALFINHDGNLLLHPDGLLSDSVLDPGGGGGWCPG